MRTSKKSNSTQNAFKAGNSGRGLMFGTALCLALGACSTQPNTQATLYQQLGGGPAIENIVSEFISLHKNIPHIAKHFEESNMTRFEQKLTEQLCAISDGPCDYSGDEMHLVHQGMNINEGEFNKTVDLMITAMDNAGVSISARNQLLARLAPMQRDIVYK